MHLGNRSFYWTNIHKRTPVIRDQVITFGKTERLIQGLHQLGQAYLFRRPLEDIAPLDAAVARHKAFVAQLFEDVGHESPAQAELGRNLASAPSLRLLVQVSKDEERVIDFAIEQGHNGALGLRLGAFRK